MAELRADIASGELKPIYVLDGQEPYLLRTAWELLYEAAIGTGPRGFNEQVFQGETASGSAIAAACNTVPMMASRRVVGVRGVNRLKADEQARLGDYCKQPSPTTVLILQADLSSRSKLDGRKKLLKNARKNGRQLTFKKLYRRNLYDWIEAEVEAQGKTLDRRAGALIEATVGNDLSQIANALNNASLYVGEARHIALGDIEEVLSGRKQDALWEFLDHFSERDLARTLLDLQRLYRQGENPMGILALLNRRVAQLATAESALARGASAKDALREAGVYDNMLWKWEKLLGRFPLRDLRRAAALLIDAASDIKGGARIDPRWSLEQGVIASLGGRR